MAIDLDPKYWTLLDVRNFYRRKHNYYAQKAEQTEDAKLRARFQNRADRAYARMDIVASLGQILAEGFGRLWLPESSRIVRVDG